MESTERNAGASADINSLEVDEATARSSAQAHCAGCKKSRLSGFFGIIVSWSHLKIGSKAIAKRKPLAGQPCRTPLAMRNCPRSAPATSTCVMLSLNILRKKRQRKPQRRSRSDLHWDMQRQSQSEGHLSLVEHTRRGPERWSQSQRCCPSFA